MPNVLDSLVQAISPAWALRRAQASARLEVMRRYQAGQSTVRRKPPTDRSSGDGLMESARDKPRAWARHLDENLDIVSGMLSTMATQAAAITPEPQQLTRGGELADQENGALAEKWEDWTNDAEITGGYSWTELCHLTARTWLRDGEILVNHLENSPIDYAGLPYAVQLLEADYLPLDFTQDNITQGVEKNSNGRATAYHVWASHPGGNTAVSNFLARTQRLDARNVSHLRRVQRLHQTRGITCLHSVITRLDDLRDYEESERIAASIAASVCAVITRNPSYADPAVNATTKEREFAMAPGMIFDDMLPGEGVDLLNPSRPSAGVTDWRAVQLRAVAAGTESSYSTIARDYSGTYSSQRQELVENYFNVRRRLQAPMIARFFRPCWERFVRQSVLSGSIRVSGIDPSSVARATWNGAAVPWIDMLKEVQAESAAVTAGFKSRQQVIRERGGDPRTLTAELERDTHVQPSNDSQNSSESASNAG